VSDLRYQLARRLCEIGDRGDIAGVGLLPEVYVEMADECIRQMEWARAGHGYCRFCGTAVELSRSVRGNGDSWGAIFRERKESWDEKCPTGPEPNIHSGPYPLPLTLAPEDWKP